MPEHAPPQPAKKEPLAGLAVRVTGEYLTRFLDPVVQLGPQIVPPGLPLTVPFPKPLFSTVTLYLLDRKNRRMPGIRTGW